MINLCVLHGDVLDKPEFIIPTTGHPMTFFNLGLWVEGERYGYITVGCMNGLAVLAAKHLRPGSKVVVSGWLNRENWKDLDGKLGKQVMLKAEELEFIAPDSPGWRGKNSSEPKDKKQG